MTNRFVVVLWFASLVPCVALGQQASSDATPNFTIDQAVENGARVKVKAVASDGSETTFEALPRVDTPQEAEYYRSGGILPYVLRQLSK